VDVLTGSIDAMTASILSWGIIDPELRIDPQYLAAHPGASLSLQPGVGAEMLAAPVPEISTLAMMLAGLSLTGMAAARPERGRDRPKSASAARSAASELESCEDWWCSLRLERNAVALLGLYGQMETR
jgi:hypothetical protein